MLSAIVQLDQTLTKVLSVIPAHNTFFDMLFLFFSLQGLSIAIWLFVLIAWISWEEYRHHIFTLYFFLSFGIATILVNFIYKNLVQRTRPWLLWNVSTTYCPADFSFPSGHAAGAFASAAIFAHFDRKRRFVYYTIALFISYSRIYLYCHFILDVIVGAIIGLGIAKVLLMAETKKV